MTEREDPHFRDKARDPVCRRRASAPNSWEALSLVRTSPPQLTTLLGGSPRHLTA